MRADGKWKKWWVKFAYEFENIWGWVYLVIKWKSGYVLSKLAFKESWICINLAIALSKKNNKNK